MDMNIIIGIVSSVVIILFFILIYLKKKSERRYYALIKNEQLENLDNNRCDFEIFGEDGEKFIESKEIDSFPPNACMLEQNDNAIYKATHLVTELCKGVVSTPNKTVEIIFSPEIQKGFKDGTYRLMRNKNSGEIFADAVDKTNTIVGKGRIVQSGKIKQLAGGAFQLVSIAVAQSHLADIERSLSSIKDAINDVLTRLENEDKAKISGAFDYLSEIATHIKIHNSPTDISQQKRNVIEIIIKDSYAWRNKLNEDIRSLIDQINNIEDVDTFGTGDTYERLKDLVCKIEPLLKRHELILNLSSATNFVTSYLDPTKTEFSKINPDIQTWSIIMNSFKDTVIRTASRLFKKSVFNKNKTLQSRYESIELSASNHYNTAITQQNKHIALTNALEQSINRLLHSNGGLRLAIRFDDLGEVQKAAII